MWGYSLSGKGKGDGMASITVHVGGGLLFIIECASKTYRRWQVANAFGLDQFMKCLCAYEKFYLCYSEQWDLEQTPKT